MGVLGTVSALGWLVLLGLASAACGARSGLSLAVDSCAHPTAEICDGLDNDCDGTVDGVDVCRRRVFVIGEPHDPITPNLGGLAGGDAICQGRARAAGLDGTWLAWLSTSTVDARNRGNRFAGPFVLLNGRAIANSVADLTDGTLATPIGDDTDLDPSALGDEGVYSEDVWTGTRSDGRYAGSACGDWTIATAGSNQLVVTGAPARSDGAWTDTSQSACSSNSNQTLYCFEK